MSPSPAAPPAGLGVSMAHPPAGLGVPPTPSSTPGSPPDTAQHAPLSQQLGDPTLSVLEIWGAEYQESNALLLRPPHAELLQRLGQRERCPVQLVGTVTGDGRVSAGGRGEWTGGHMGCVDLAWEHVDKGRSVEAQGGWVWGIWASLGAGIEVWTRCRWYGLHRKV